MTAQTIEVVHRPTKVKLVPLALKDAPALIEIVFPAQKVSFEAQRERKAGSGQTLTALGSYWKGRKPLVLVRAVVLGCLLPQTDDAEKDLELFEALMGFDLNGLGRRAVDQGAIKPAELGQGIDLHNPWDYFSYTIPTGSDLVDADVRLWQFPLPASANAGALRLSWKREVSDEDKARIFAMSLATLSTYEARSILCKRPEEVDQEFLLAPVWSFVAKRLGSLGVDAKSMPELVSQLGLLRYGHRPKVGDTFAGGGSIPFEAARMGCDVFASDLNPIACMLNWGALNLVGATSDRRAKIELSQKRIADEVEAEIRSLGIESDSGGNRAKAFLYCLETRCPESGWMVPMSPSWVISRTSKVVARLSPDHKRKRFDIEVVTGASSSAMAQAETGTVQDGALVYQIDGKTYRTPIRTIRGDHKDVNGDAANKLRRWEKGDFKPRPDDILQERLYAIQWISRETIASRRQVTFFASVSQDDVEREALVERLVGQNLRDWQDQGLVSDMAIEPGDKTDEPIRTRGWTYWHHLFSPRHLLLLAKLREKLLSEEWGVLCFSNLLNYYSKLAGINARTAGSGREMCLDRVFINQALNTLMNWGVRSYAYFPDTAFDLPSADVPGQGTVKSSGADLLGDNADIFVTDPPYADAVHYHEITEYFIAWLRKNPIEPFNEWNWDSRRALAIKGTGDDFRRGMIDAYKAMADHMPQNGMQCVMFTHQDVGVWSDMVGIFWAAGLQVVAAWYIATETTSELKKGGYVQGTVTLMLKKRAAGEKVGFKQRILPAVRHEVDAQIKQMMHLNSEVKESMGEPVFNDSDLQMAGYAAALKVLTAYTSIGGMDVTTFALRPRVKGEVTVVDEIVQQASEAANNLLVPEGLPLDTWQSISGVQRFYLRMMDMESTGASKLDNYQNFAKAFRVENYASLMSSMTANSARLKQPGEFASRDLSDSTEIGPTWLGQLFIALQQLLKDVEPQTVVLQLVEALPDYMESRLKLIQLAAFLSRKATHPEMRAAAETLAARMQNQRALDQ